MQRKVFTKQKTRALFMRHQSFTTPVQKVRCARACTRSLLLSRQPTVTRDTSYNDIKINLCCVFNITKKKLTVLL